MSRIIFSILATDPKYCTILLQYLDVLLQRDLVQIVHLWNYVTNSTTHEAISQLCHRNSKYVLFEPRLPDHKKGHYYQHYSKYLQEEDILIKCDDRVVYLDIDTFRHFTDRITEDGLYFPNIVNNDVCAFFQQEEGSHHLFNYKVDREGLRQLIAKSGEVTPLSDWHREHDKADKIHRMFLKNKSRFSVDTNPNKMIEYGNYVHLNIYGTTARFAKEMFVGIHPDVTFTDHQYFAMAPLHTHKKNKVCLGFLAVYFAFDEQNIPNLEDKYLAKYEALSESFTNTRC